MNTSDYLNYSVDYNSPDFVSVYDEQPLWSAMAGLLLLRHVPLRPGLRVLDVGCGTGFPLFELAQRLGPTSQVSGLDPWEAALRRAREKQRQWNLPNVEIRQGSAAEMPYADDTFDLIVSNLGVNNFNNPEQVMAECRRVTKPGGKLAITTNLKGHMQEFYEVFETTLRELGQTSALPALHAHIDHRATLAGVESLFQGAGYRLCRVVEERQVMRFADGSALLRHAFIKLGFLDGWKQVVAEAERPLVFARLEANLNEQARAAGELSLTIPLAYFEGEKRDEF